MAFGFGRRATTVSGMNNSGSGESDFHSVAGICLLSPKHHPHDHDHDSEGQCRPRSDRNSISEYSNHGVHFRYPSDWELSEQTNDDETSISVQSPGTSFWTLVLIKSRPDPDEVLNSVVEAFEMDYEGVDVLTYVGSLCGLATLGRDLDFVCYDLLNSAVLRSFQTSEKTVFVLFQGTDHELVSTRPQLEAITSSLHCDDEDEIL